MSDGSEALGIFAVGTSPQSSSEGWQPLPPVTGVVDCSCFVPYLLWDLGRSPIALVFPSLLQQSSKVTPQSWCGTGGGVGCRAPQLPWWQVDTRQGHSFQLHAGLLGRRSEESQLHRHSPWRTGKQIRGCLPSGAARPRTVYSASSLTELGLLASYTRCDSVHSMCSLRASPGFCKTLKQELETWLRG